MATWVRKKVDLPQPIRYVVAREVGKRAAREFQHFSEMLDAVAYLEANRGGALHEVLVSMDRPCWLYMDIDAPVAEVQEGLCPFDPEDPLRLEEVSRMLCEAVLAELELFLREKHGMEVELQLGKGCVEVAVSSRPTKISLHVLVRVCFASVSLLKLAIASFRDALRSSGKGLLAASIDPMVYSNFRSYRALGMAKQDGNGVALRAVWGSSDRVLDHLVGYYEGLSPAPLAVVDTLPYKISTQQRIVPQRRTKTEVTDGGGAVLLPLGAAGLWHRPVGHYRVVAEAVRDSTEVQDVLYEERRPVVLQDWLELRCGMCIYGVDPRTRPVCPYARRVHRGNRLYFLYEREQQSLTLRCHDDGCKGILDPYTFSYEDTGDELARIQSDAAAKTVHGNSQSVEWTEVYNEPAMRAYPRVPFLVVRANMGVGKTMALGQYLERHLSHDSRVLVITFSQALARKYAHELSRFGIVSYLQHTHTRTLNQPRLVVCLDSLWKVEMTKADVLLLDESTSVLQHFQSDVMQHVSQNLSKFEQLMVQSDHVVMLDAASDHPTSYQTVRYMEQLREGRAHWVWNQFVRPSGRQATIYVGKLGTKAAPKADSVALSSILRRLEEGGRLVVPTSSRTFAKQVYETVSKRFPEKVIRAYHSETPRDVMESDLSDPMQAWDALDCLIYSPSVSAGVSYTGKRFTSLVAYFSVGPLTPSADVALQMLYRVRELCGGVMELFVQTQDFDAATTEAGVERQLAASVALYSMLGVPDLHAHQALPGGVCTWDKDRFSYTLLRNMVLSNNRSNRHFAEIVENTLREDYGIPTRLVALGSDDAQVEVEVEELPSRAKMPEWRVGFAPTEENAARWVAYGGADADVLRCAFKATQRAARFLMVPPERVDREFYERFVVNDMVKRAATLRYTLRTTYAENQGRLEERLRGLQEGDPNLELHRWAIRKRYVLQLLGQQFLERVVSAEAYAALKADLRPVDVSRKEAEGWVKGLLGSMNATEHRGLRQLLSRKELAEKKPVCLVNNILTAAFGVSLNANRTKDKGSKRYDVMKLDTAIWSELAAKYDSPFFVEQKE